MELGNLSSISSNIATTYTKTSDTDKAAASEEKESSSKSSFSETAVVYEKSSTSNDKVYKKNDIDRSALVKQLQEETERLQNNLLDIVRKSITGQGNSFAIASGDDSIWKIISSGNFTASAEDIAQAKKDIAEDGYWGVEQTSSRIVDFAIALSGDDTSKAETLINAFKKGFSQATSAWGKTLPDISQKTYDAVMTKFDSWKNGTYGSEETTTEE